MSAAAPDAARARSIAIVATGDELVSGVLLDGNSALIARELAAHGLEPRRFTVLGDDEDALVHLLLELAPVHGAIVLTGGLGPTLDDVTRHACARAAGVELVRDDAVLEGLRGLYARRGRPFPAANERQALFPRGARVLANHLGTAAGFEVGVAGCAVFALPGPPREMAPMLAAEVLPRVVAGARGAAAVERRSFHLFGLPESAFADAAGAWMDRAANPRMGVTSNAGRLAVSLRAQAPTREAAARLADARAAEVRERFAEWLFSEDEPDLALATGRLLIARGLTVATAESCTGGLLAERLTRVPGISAVFGFGFVTYADRAKTELLGVDPALLAAHGAVSAEVAAAMARGAAERSGARLAVSITGIAGPGGGSPHKPPGLVWFGLWSAGTLATQERRFPDLGRDLIREFAAGTALDLLRRAALAAADDRAR